MFKKYTLYALAGLLTLHASAHYPHNSSDATFVQKYEPELTAAAFAGLGGVTTAAVAAWFGSDARDIVTKSCLGSALFAYFGLPLLTSKATSRENSWRKVKACLELMGISLTAAGLSCKQEALTWVGAMWTAYCACL